MEKLNGVDVAFNMADVDFYERYMENASGLDDAMSDRLSEKELSDYRNIIRVGRKKCKGVKAFLEKVFGEGMGDTICGPVNDIVVCSEVYNSIIKIADRQAKQMAERMQAVSKNDTVIIEE